MQRNLIWEHRLFEFKLCHKDAETAKDICQGKKIKAQLIIVLCTTARSGFGWLFGFYGISTFAAYLTTNTFLYK